MIEPSESSSRYVVEHCEDEDAWNSFLVQNGGPPYAHWGWSEAVTSYGHDRWHLAVRTRDEGDIAAVIPLYHVKSRLFGSQLLSPAFAERGAVVSNGEGNATEARRLLLRRTKRIADRLDVDFAILRGTGAGEADGFSLENRYVTFHVPVDRDVEAVRSDVKDSRLRQIEQAAENSSLEVQIGRSLDDLRAYYRLYLETMRGHGSPPHSFDFFRILWDELHEEGNLRLSMVRRDGSLINGMIDLSLGSTVYQWGVVSDYEFRDLNGGSLLLWKSLQWAADAGYDTYEFGRTREGTGVYMFKKSFGGSKVWYDDLHYYPDGSGDPPDPENETYETAKKIWQRLPLPVTRVVGPRIRKRIGI